MKKILSLLITLLLPISVFAHSLLLNVFDNEDNTITIEGEFNTGESAAGANVQLIALNSEKILFEKRLSDESELTVSIPKQAYKIVLDGGPGHKIIKKGIPPKEGFKKEIKKEAKKTDENKNGKLNMSISSNIATTTLLLVAFLLLFSTIFISIRNTNKLLNEINHKK